MLGASSAVSQWDIDRGWGDTANDDNKRWFCVILVNRVNV